MKTRALICVVYGLSMTILNILSSDYTTYGILRAVLLGGVALAVFYAFFAIANRVTNNGLDSYLEQLRDKR